MKITVTDEISFEQLDLSYLSSFEYSLALGVEEIVAPQGLVEHVGTDTKFLGV